MRRYKLTTISEISAAILMFVILLAGCSANMTKYYSNLTEQMSRGDYKGAVAEVQKSQDKYGAKNLLMFYLDSGVLSHYDGAFEISRANFENAKILFDDYYAKSISAGALSMLYNDSSMPYYGENFERAYIALFQSLNYILDGQDNEAVVEARQINSLFKFFVSQKSFYQDDGFLEYFMGLVYENAGYLNDASISYYAALKNYGKKGGVSDIAASADAIDDAYSSAIKLGINARASEIKKNYPSAKRKEIPNNSGELILIDYNGIIVQKTEFVISMAIGNAWVYMNTSNIDGAQMEDYRRATSIGMSAFASDYIQFSIPVYKPLPYNVYSFIAEAGGQKRQSYIVQDLAQIAQKNLESRRAKNIAKTAVRAIIKYILSKQASAEVEKKYGKGYGLLVSTAANIYTAATEIADLRAWNTLPANILMARMYLPAGENKVVINYFDKNSRQIRTETLTVNISEGKKNFVVLKTAS